MWWRVTAIPFSPNSPKFQASDWWATQEANLNNNNSLVAPIRGLDFWELLGTKKLLPSTTPNLQRHSAKTGKFVAVSLPYSYLYAISAIIC